MASVLSKTKLKEMHRLALEESHHYHAKVRPWIRGEFYKAAFKVSMAVLITGAVAAKTFDRINSNEPNSSTMTGFQTEALANCVGNSNIRACELRSVERNVEEWRDERWKSNALVLAGTLIPMFYTWSQWKGFRRIEKEKHDAETKNKNCESRIFTYGELLDNWGGKEKPRRRPTIEETEQRIWKNAPHLQGRKQQLGKE